MQTLTDMHMQTLRVNRAYFCKNMYVRPHLHQASVLQWCLRHISRWPQCRHLRIGLQPILERLHYGQWEMCGKRHRSVDADAWCKRALNHEFSPFSNNISKRRWVALTRPQETKEYLRYSRVLVVTELVVKACSHRTSPSHQRTKRYVDEQNEYATRSAH